MRSISLKFWPIGCGRFLRFLSEIGLISWQIPTLLSTLEIKVWRGKFLQSYRQYSRGQPQTSWPHPTSNSPKFLEENWFEWLPTSFHFLNTFFLHSRSNFPISSIQGMYLSIFSSKSKTLSTFLDVDFCFNFHLTFRIFHTNYAIICPHTNDNIFYSIGTILKCNLPVSTLKKRISNCWSGPTKFYSQKYWANKV